jgi:hypothetical protein
MNIDAPYQSTTPSHGLGELIIFNTIFHAQLVTNCGLFIKNTAFSNSCLTNVVKKNAAPLVNFHNNHGWSTPHYK